MKKAWGALLAAVLLCMASAVPAFGADAPTLELRPSVQAVSPGGEFTVDLYIYNNPGIAGLNFAIRYDESALQLFNAVGQALTDWQVGIKANPQDDDPVREEKAVWAPRPIQNWTGSDCGILRLSFRVPENAPTGETTITIDGLFAMNAGREKVSFNITPAAVIIRQEPPPTGVSVGGEITSYGSGEEAVTVTLTKQGETAPAFTKTVTGNSAAYSFGDVPAGDYVLKVEKRGHAPWTETVTVSDSDITKNVKVYLYGDVNRNGKVTSADALQVNQYIAGMRSFDSYQMALADVNKKNGITSADALWIEQRVAEMRDSDYKTIV